MVDKDMKKGSIVLNIREMKNKTTRRYHFISIKMAILKTKSENKCWQECEEIITLCTIAGRNVKLGRHQKII